MTRWRHPDLDEAEASLGLRPYPGALERAPGDSARPETPSPGLVHRSRHGGTPMTAPTANRNPIAEHLRKVGPAVAALVTTVTGLGSMLGWSASQTAALEEYGGQLTAAAAPTGPIAIAVGAIIGLVSGGATLLATLKAGRGAEAQTTPVTSPRDVDGTPLVRRDGLPLGGGAAVDSDRTSTIDGGGFSAGHPYAG